MDIFLLLSQLTVVVCCVHLHQSNEEEEGRRKKKRKKEENVGMSVRECARVGTCACVHSSVSTCGRAGITVNRCLLPRGGTELHFIFV